MQPSTKPEQYNSCETGVLSADRVQAFRDYLDSHGCQTRAGNGGQHFHVMTTQGWATLTRARKDRVGTPRWMRRVVEGFLVSAKTAMAPEFWERFGISAATIPRQCSLELAQYRTVSLDLASGKDCTVEALIAGSKVVARRALQPVVASAATPAAIGPKPAAQDAQYLQDLRDDFALHSPLWIKEGEALEEFAARRWEYAAAMMSTRPVSMI